MLAFLIQSALAAACLLFVISLPIWKLAIAATMRRIAVTLFLGALLPSLFFGLVTPAPSPRGTTSTPTQPTAAHPLEVLGGLVVLCVVAWAILEIRKRMNKTSKDAWSEFVSLRSSGKKPVGDPHATHTPSLFDEEP